MDSSLKAVLGIAILMVLAVMLGVMLVLDVWQLAFMTAGAMWLLLLPYHHVIATHLAVATFGTALLVPFAPGRPFAWEFAALFGWTGAALLLVMRRHHPGTQEMLLKNRFILIGFVGYAITLMLIMRYRGVGMAIMGSSTVGGRFYFQQLACIIFPLLFAIAPPSPTVLTRLFFVQCMLMCTFVFSDMAFVYNLPGSQWLLQLLEVPVDAFNFAAQVNRFGFRRFQSLYSMSTGLIYLLLVLYPLRAAFTSRGFLLVPALLILFVVGMMSGHRFLSAIIVLTTTFCAFGQKFYNIRNLLISGIGVLLLLVSFYLVAPNLPLAAQRAISFLPGISIDAAARQDADGTWAMRSGLRDIGLKMSADYFWMGRGFGMQADDYAKVWDPTGTEYHIARGRFYNGIVGLLVNTGGAGFLFMAIFFAASSYLAWKVLLLTRRTGASSRFERLACLTASLFFANLIAFLFLHGDSESAAKTFSLQAALLIVCRYHLEHHSGTISRNAVAPNSPLTPAKDT
jgi:hypothetical protein